jgi:Cof subfamily protein (haloacid dehalogenase superfamily)
MTASARVPSDKISAVISDVDGTLVTNDKILTPATMSAVAKLHASGIIFGLISARPPRGLIMLRGPLGITTPLIGFNGGVVAGPDLAIITEHLLLPGIARRAVELLTAYGAEVWVFSGQDWLLRHADDPYVSLEERTIGFSPTIVEEFGPALDVAAKIVGVSRDFALLARREREFAALLAGDASVVRSQAFYLDITHPLANKGAAVSAFAKLLAITLTEIPGNGDGGNDVAMFERSGLSIAMGNASPEVKQAADLVTESNVEDGFSNAIGHFILGGHRANVPTGDDCEGIRAC